MTGTEEALSASVMAIDSSRRVGWAKAFAAQEQLEEAEQMWNVTTGDRDAYRNATSLLWGVLSVMPGVDLVALKDSLFDLTGDIEPLLDATATAAGRRRGARFAAAVSAAVGRMEAKSEKKRSSSALDKAHQSGSRRAIAKMVRAHGFDSPEEMAAVLDKWSKAAGRRPHRKSVWIGRYEVGPSSEYKHRKAYGSTS